MPTCIKKSIYVFSQNQGETERLLGFEKVLRAHHPCLFTCAKRSKKKGEQDHGDFPNRAQINEATRGLSHLFVDACVRA